MVWKGPDIIQEAPDSFNPEDPYADPVALHEAREASVWRKEVRIEKAKILRERMKQCYIKEGVNHLQNCREQVQRYLDSLQDTGVQRQNADFYQLWRVKHDKEANAK
ncbi:hypothetical protein WJX74_010439 [Apatococcus lobatus]|uniref:NADH-ubiquinone oxidoreductase 12 kDa subunit n=2 Tax=Apatococcus TaxID=904362 RepID=A0AAW1SZG9_9CHLO